MAFQMENVILSEAERPDTEVTSKSTRRRFAAKYKRQILRAAAACTKPGEIGALLRREGLYSSHLAKWRKQAEAGELSGLTPKRRGPKPRPADARDKQLARLEREVARQRRRAERAEAVIEVQKKVSQLLGIALPTDGNTEDE